MEVYESTARPAVMSALEVNAAINIGVLRGKGIFGEEMGLGRFYNGVLGFDSFLMCDFLWGFIGI